jgi:hypothetical protein
MTATGLLLLVACAASTGLETVAAYGFIWFLLLSGVRVMVSFSGRGGARQGDARSLRELTGLAAGIWIFVWLIATLAALAFGGRLPV